MHRFLAALAAIAIGLFSPARAEAPRPREHLESLSLLAARSMVQILESEQRFQPFTPGPDGGERLPNERWLYAGERVARVSVEEFPEYFALEDCQRELGLWVGANDEELDRRLTGWRVPRALVRGAERLADRARKAG